MSLSDWDSFITNQPGLSLAINVLTPLISLGSGRIGGSSLTGGTSSALIHVSTASGRTRGVTHGKYRSIFRYDDFTTGGFIGFTFLQSVLNIAGSTGNFYSAYIKQSDGKLYLAKTTGNNVANGGTSLGTAYFSPGINTVFTLEAEWIVDVTELGGTAMFVRRGFETDFSDLTTVISYLDASSPFITSLAESIFVVETSSGGVFNVDFDETALYIP